MPERVSRALEIPLRPVEYEGSRSSSKAGSIDVDGRGTPAHHRGVQPRSRRPGPQSGNGPRRFRARREGRPGRDEGDLAGRGHRGDDTHGHVDDLARFVSPTRVLLCRETDPADANYRPLEENRERLRGARNADGERIEVVPLPMPRPLYLDGQRLPASYANFYLANAAVLVPTFNDPADREALGILAEQFPDRPVIGIHSVDLVWGLGTLHCLSQQQPAR